jgi:hypothetical protein
MLGIIKPWTDAESSPVRDVNLGLVVGCRESNEHIIPEGNSGERPTRSPAAIKMLSRMMERPIRESTSQMKI